MCLREQCMKILFDRFHVQSTLSSPWLLVTRDLFGACTLRNKVQAGHAQSASNLWFKLSPLNSQVLTDASAR